MEPLYSKFMTDVLTYINKSVKVQSNLTENFLCDPSHPKGFFMVFYAIQSFLFII